MSLLPPPCPPGDPSPRQVLVVDPMLATGHSAAAGIARLKAMGHEVEVDPDALASHTRFAGDDDTRLAAIGRAAASGADVALISRGGYGLTRLLPRLPYKAIAKAIERGTEFVGISDFTAFQNAVLAKTDPAAGTKGISCFIVEADRPGVSWGTHEDKMGLRGSSTVPLVFDGCEVPSSALLAKEGGGLSVALTALVGSAIYGVSRTPILREGVPWMRAAMVRRPCGP